MALVKVLGLKKSAGGVSTAACSRRGGVDVAERSASRGGGGSDGRVCDGDARRGWVDEKLVASDDGSGGLAGWVSYYVIVLVRVVTRKARAGEA